MNFTTSFATFSAIFATLAPSLAHADVTALAYVQDERTAVPAPPANTSATATSMTAGNSVVGQYAFALADQVNGVMRLAGNSGASYPYITTSDASTSFTQYVTFSGGFGQTAYLDYSFDGNLGINAPQSAPAAAFAQLQVYAATNIGSFVNYETLSGYAGNCGTGTNCVVGTSTSRTGSLAFNIYDGPIYLAMSMTAFASFGNTFDFANTAKFYLRAPEGVTYTSTNGFLSQALPIGSGPVTPVPEPSTYALLTAGLALIAFAARGRQKV